MLCALGMSVHSTHIMYGVECPCRGLHTLVMGLSAVVTPQILGCLVDNSSTCVISVSHIMRPNT